MDAGLGTAREGSDHGADLVALSLHVKYTPFSFSQILKKAVYRNLRGNLQRRHTMQRLHIFPDEIVPENILQNISNQIRQQRLPPKRLDEYTEEERTTFPKIIDYPKDYILR